MKIAVVRPYFHPIEFTFCKYLAREGNDVSLVATRDGSYPTSSNTFNVKLYKANLKFYNFPISLEILHQLKKESFDVINASGPLEPCTIQSFIATKRTKAKLFLTSEKYSDWGIFIADKMYNTLLKVIAPPIFKQSRKIIARSIAAKMYMKRRKFPYHKVIYIPIGVDTEVFKVIKLDVESIKRKYEIPENSYPVILSVARLIHRKKLDVLLYVFKEVLKQLKDAFLVVRGDGPLKSYLKHIARNLKVHHNFSIIPPLNYKNLPLIYNISDLFVLTSVREEFGVAGLEAEACGVPCVVSNVGGLRDYILNGVNGFLVKPSDINGFTDKIVYLSDPKKRKEFIKAGFNIVKKFSWNRLIKRYIKIFEEC